MKEALLQEDEFASWFEERPQATYEERREIYARAGACCESVDENGVRCTRKYGLRIAFGDDGAKLLCRSHELWSFARGRRRSQR